MKDNIYFMEMACLYYNLKYHTCDTLERASKHISFSQENLYKRGFLKYTAHMYINIYFFSVSNYSVFYSFFF